MGNQKFHFVCLTCRRSIKRRVDWQDWRWILEEDGSEATILRSISCAICGGEMIYVGKYFAAPKRRDDAGWKKLAWMIENGWRGDGWRRSAWPVAPAMNLNAVRESLRTSRIARNARLQREKERESFDVAKRRARNLRTRNLRTARKREQRELKAQQKYQDAVLARVQSEN